MTTEVEMIYHFEDGIPRNHFNPAAVEFKKNNGQYLTTVMLNQKYKNIRSKVFILFPTKPTAAIKSLGNNDIEASIAQGYYVDIEYHEDDEVDEKTLISRGFAKTS